MHITTPCFNLTHTLESGQFFRYERIHDGYLCCERDRSFHISQTKDTLAFKGTRKEHIKTLFGLHHNYNDIIHVLSKDSKLAPLIQKYAGLRIMQRDPWETLISFQCSIMSNIKKIKLNMNLLAKTFGENNRTYAAFPKPGHINDLEKIKQCATGFRAKYIHAANLLVDDAYFLKLKKMTYKDAKETLMELPGVAEKVADCVCLFGLGKLEAFPVDVWIERAMKKLYGVEKTKDIRGFAKERWGEHAGYAQQFLYHGIRNVT